MPDLYHATQEHKALVQAIRDALGDDADEQTVADTVEGESTIEDAIAATIREARATLAMRNGLVELMEDMEKRAKRLAYRSERLMTAALQAALECNIPKVQGNDFTASVGQSKGKVVISDEAQLPDEAFRTKREVNRSWIRDQLLTGVEVPGASLSNPEPHWTVRTT